MIKNNTISVVISVKDEVDSLLLCLKSLFKQKDLPNEIIVVANELTTKKIKIKLSSSKLKSIRLVVSEGDKNEARNKGVESAKSKFILYLDHDMRIDSELIQRLRKMSLKFNVLIVPEKGLGGGFLSEVKKLEKELIMYDLDAVSPRFFKKTIFKKENPFNGNFGLLDEWGFSQRLKERKVQAGIVDSFIYVDESSISLLKEIKNKFNRGLWMKAFLSTDKNEALRRTDPIRRGVVFYGKRISLIIKHPILFPSLILLKTIDFLSFMFGFLWSSRLDVTKPSVIKPEEQFYLVHDKLGGKYLKNMFLNTGWGRYVNGREKQAVIDIWRLSDSKLNKESILDLGAGPGRWSRLFLDLGFKEVTALDFSTKMISFCRQTIKNERFSATAGKMEKLPFSSNSFDKVFNFRAFKYSQNPNRALEEVERVLKKDGEFLLEISNKSILNRTLKTISTFIIMLFPKIALDSRLRYFSSVNFYELKDIEAFTTNKNLKLMNYRKLFVFPSVSLPRNLDLLFFPLLKITNNIFEKIPPEKYFTRSYLILLKKSNGQ